MGVLDGGCRWCWMRSESVRVRNTMTASAGDGGHGRPSLDRVPSPDGSDYDRSVSKSTGTQWMGTPDVTTYLGLQLRTLYRLIDEGQLPAYKFGRVIRLKREEVEAFVEGARIRPGELRHLYPVPADERGEEEC